MRGVVTDAAMTGRVEPAGDGAAPAPGWPAAVRQRFLDDFARRAAAQPAAVQAALRARLEALEKDTLPRMLPVDGAGVGQGHRHGHGHGDALAHHDAALVARAPGPLAGLVSRLSRGVAGSGDAAPEAGPLSGTAPPGGRPSHAVPAAGPMPPAAASLDWFRRTWSRLSAAQRLAQSRATLPGNAGPLHSHHLVHQALTLMHEVSPDCLEHFLAQADALAWLEDSAPGRAG